MVVRAATVLKVRVKGPSSSVFPYTEKPFSRVEVRMVERECSTPRYQNRDIPWARVVSGLSVEDFVTLIRAVQSWSITFVFTKLVSRVKPVSFRVCCPNLPCKQ